MKKFFEQKKSAIVSGMSNNKGFSLVELIIVVAIMAVLMGVLAPQYLRFVESSRVQTDMTAVNEVVKVTRIALATFSGIPTDTKITVNVGGGVTVADTDPDIEAAMKKEIDATLGSGGSTVGAMSSAFYKDTVNDVVLGIANDNGVPFVYLVSCSGGAESQLSYDLKLPYNSSSVPTADEIEDTDPGLY